MLQLKLSGLVLHCITLPGFQMKIDFLSLVITLIIESRVNFMTSFNAKSIF